MRTFVPPLPFCKQSSQNQARQLQWDSSALIGGCSCFFICLCLSDNFSKYDKSHKLRTVTLINALFRGTKHFPYFFLRCLSSVSSPCSPCADCMLNVAVTSKANANGGNRAVSLAGRRAIIHTPQEHICCYCDSCLDRSLSKPA